MAGKLERHIDVSGPEGDPVGTLVRECVSEGHSVIVFCPTKKGCEVGAQRLAKAPFMKNLGKDEPLAILMEELRRTPTGAESGLLEIVPFGVAYHHAGLTTEERSLVEEAFRSLHVVVLFATSTLAAGVNLPARRVIINGPKIGQAFLDPAKYHQMVGRAGRAGLDTKGESFLVYRPADQSPVLRLVSDPLPPMISALGNGRGLSRALLEAIAAKLISNTADIDRFVAETLYFQQETREKLSECITQCLKYLHDSDFVDQMPQTAASRPPLGPLATESQPAETRLSDKLRVTKLGIATVASSLPPSEGMLIFEDLQLARRHLLLDSELHLMYLATPIYTQTEPNWAIYPSMHRKLSPECLQVADLIGIKMEYLEQASEFPPAYNSPSKDARRHRRFYAALALWELTHNEAPLWQVSRDFRIERGALQALQNNASSFATMTATFAAKLGWWEFDMLLTGLSGRLNYGVQPDALPLCMIAKVGGARARVLYNAGFHTVAAVAASKPEKIFSVLQQAMAFRAKTSKPNPNRVFDVEGFVGLSTAAKIVSSARELVRTGKAPAAASDDPHTLPFELPPPPIFQRNINPVLRHTVRPFQSKHDRPSLPLTAASQRQSGHELFTPPQPLSNWPSGSGPGRPPSPSQAQPTPLLLPSTNPPIETPLSSAHETGRGSSCCSPLVSYEVKSRLPPQEDARIRAFLRQWGKESVFGLAVQATPKDRKLMALAVTWPPPASEAPKIHFVRFDWTAPPGNSGRGAERAAEREEHEGGVHDEGGAAGAAVQQHSAAGASAGPCGG
eukprot:TRINITY_DN2368_c0_g1_i14.p1 TRINITY_DN2368_c0_g1~~TRINITY_DN2368_c0_g1_i14.p1  ORF type:complete len:792 (+),score=170.84 TRINITY_DN2368_c0_g1_i14:2006-4381(+)